MDAVGTQVTFVRGIILNDPERNFLLFLGTAQRAVVEINTKYLEFLGIIYLVHRQRFSKN